MKGYVYILKSLKDGKQYIGSSINVNERLTKHNSGYVESTRNRRPLVLKYILEYEKIEVAAVMEKKFKRSHDALRRELEKRRLVHRKNARFGTER